MLDQKIINLYDEYTHKPLTRKDFMVRLVQLAGSTTAALSMLSMLESGCSTAAKTPTDELMTENVTYPGAKGDMMAYVARPKANKKYAAVVVIHENRGLNAHIEDVTRRVARAGYLAIAPNALSPLGGTPANEDEKARKLFTQNQCGRQFAEFYQSLRLPRQPKRLQRPLRLRRFLLGRRHV